MARNTYTTFFRMFPIFIISSMLTGNIIVAQELLYREESGDNVYFYHYSFSKITDGYRIKVARTADGDTTDKQVLVTDPDFRTRSWHYIRFGEHTDVYARLNEKGVQIKGHLDGDELDEFEELDKNEPWIQLFPMNPGMESFIFSAETELVFWSIATESPADMEINSFSAIKKENAYSDEFGCKTLRINFSPTGWRSYFWNGDYYFRAYDARVVGYRGDGAPRKPSAKTTLIREE